MILSQKTGRERSGRRRGRRAPQRRSMKGDLMDAIAPNSDPCASRRPSGPRSTNASSPGATCAASSGPIPSPMRFWPGSCRPPITRLRSASCSPGTSSWSAIRRSSSASMPPSRRRMRRRQKCSRASGNPPIGPSSSRASSRRRGALHHLRPQPRRPHRARPHPSDARWISTAPSARCRTCGSPPARRASASAGSASSATRTSAQHWAFPDDPAHRLSLPRLCQRVPARPGAGDQGLA